MISDCGNNLWIISFSIDSFASVVIQLQSNRNDDKCVDFIHLFYRFLNLTLQRALYEIDFSFCLYSFAQDTMMDCGGDGGGLEDFVDLATDITDNSPTIRGNLFITFLHSLFLLLNTDLQICIRILKI